MLKVCSENIILKKTCYKYAVRVLLKKKNMLKVCNESIIKKKTC